MTPDVNVILMDFRETKEREMITENPDGSYTIFINARLSTAAQLSAYRHALSHINGNDFEKTDVQQIEAMAHNPQPAIPASKFEAFIERRNKERRKLQAKMRKYERKIEFIMEHEESPNAYFMSRAEDYWAYGDNL